MAIRGAKPKPASLKDLHGTSRPDRAKNEPVPPSGKLTPTDQIERVQYARGYWDHFLKTAPRGMLKPLDVPLLERLCVALAMARQAMDQVAALGLVVKTGERKDKDGNMSGGVAVQNPFLPIVNRQTEIARKLAAELGLPVTARARLDAPEAPDQPNGDEETQGSESRGDALDAFLDRHPGRTLN